MRPSPCAAVAPVAEPTVVDTILVDHKHSLTLLSHAFRAASAADSAEGRGAAVAAGLARAAAGAVALDVLLHSQAGAPHRPSLSIS